MPVRQIYDDLMREHSVGIIRRAIALLIKLGLLEQRHNPGNGQDRTWQYRLNLLVLNSKLDEHGEVESETPIVDSDQCSTQDQSTNIKSTEQVVKKVSNHPEEIIEKYEEKLKDYGIYPKHRPGGKDLVPNPKLEPILRMLAKIPRERAE